MWLRSSETPSGAQLPPAAPVQPLDGGGDRTSAALETHLGHICLWGAAPSTLRQTVLSNQLCFGVRGGSEVGLIMLFLLRAAPRCSGPDTATMSPPLGGFCSCGFSVKSNMGLQLHWAPLLPGWRDHRERGGPQIPRGAMGHLSLAGLRRTKKRELPCGFSCDNAALCSIHGTQ